jgi:hypothetical protein
MQLFTGSGGKHNDLVNGHTATIRSFERRSAPFQFCRLFQIRSHPIGVNSLIKDFGIDKSKLRVTFITPETQACDFRKDGPHPTHYPHRTHSITSRHNNRFPVV